jgi:hypothetical protein
MSESVRRTRGERVITALGFSLLAVLIAALDYWTYHVLSSQNVLAGLGSLIVSYAAFSVVLWLLCIVAHAIARHRREPPAAAERRPHVDQACRRQRQPRTRPGACFPVGPRRRQRSQPRCGSN